jgi:hypothetical protein
VLCVAVDVADFPFAPLVTVIEVLSGSKSYCGSKTKLNAVVDTVLTA